MYSQVSARQLFRAGFAFHQSRRVDDVELEFLVSWLIPHTLPKSHKLNTTEQFQIYKHHKHNKWTNTLTHTHSDTILPTIDHTTTPHPPYYSLPHPISPQAATQQGQDTTNSSSSTSIQRDWRSAIPARNSCLAKLVSILQWVYVRLGRR